MLKVLEKANVLVGSIAISSPHGPTQLAVALPFSVTSLLPNPRKSYSILADQLLNRPNSRPMPAIQPQRFLLPLHAPVPLTAEHSKPPPPSIIEMTGPARRPPCVQELALNWLLTLYLSLA